MHVVGVGWLEPPPGIHVFLAVWHLGVSAPNPPGIRILCVSGHLTPGLSGPGPSAVKVNYGNQISSEQSCSMICGKQCFDICLGHISGAEGAQKVAENKVGISDENPYLTCMPGACPKYPPPRRASMGPQMDHLECLGGHFRASLQTMPNVTFTSQGPVDFGYVKGRSM